MHNVPTILQPANSGSAVAGTTGFRTLPSDLREQSVRRLYYVAVGMGALWSLSLLAQSVASRAGLFPAPSLATTMIRLLGTAVACAMIAVAGNRRITLATQSDVGVAFEVVGAATFASYEQTLLPELGVMPGPISVVSLWILLFRLFVPSSSYRALVAGLLATATLPATVYLLDAMGRDTVPRAVTSLQLKVTLGTALLGWLAARVIYRLGTQVGKARTMGAYRLEERLGQGGMGEVWRASHARLKRPAAIKLMDPSVLSKRDGIGKRETVIRFEREAQATADLGSPHTVTIYDYGVTEDGELYYVMEYLDGDDLDTLVARTGPLSASRAAHLLVQICRSLSEAHLRGLVHRDIKPSNIVVGRVGTVWDFVKVLDFGLVKRLSPEIVDTTATKDGVVAGTPAFMAPEMVLGDRPPDARTDVYQLGCTAYWMLSGRLVFEGRSAVAMMSDHIHAEPVPVAERSEVEIPAELGELVMQCLAKDPEQRPASVDEVADRLSRIQFEPEWTQDRARRWWEVHAPEKSLVSVIDHPDGPGSLR